MPATAPDQIVAEQLVSALGGSWAIDTNIFLGPARAPEPDVVPDEAIFVLANGGPVPPAPYFGGESAPSFRQPAVQVRVRGPVDDFESARVLARNVWAALNKATLTGYLACMPQQGEPVYIGIDATNHHELAINLLLWLVE
jgi:hypothetical protein